MNLKEIRERLMDRRNDAKRYAERGRSYGKRREAMGRLKAYQLAIELIERRIA